MNLTSRLLEKYVLSEPHCRCSLDTYILRKVVFGTMESLLYTMNCAISTSFHLTIASVHFFQTSTLRTCVSVPLTRAQHVTERRELRGDMCTTPRQRDVIGCVTGAVGAARTTLSSRDTAWRYVWSRVRSKLPFFLQHRSYRATGRACFCSRPALTHLIQMINIQTEDHD